jgi:hypothetical protein
VYLGEVAARHHPTPGKPSPEEQKKIEFVALCHTGDIFIDTLLLGICSN